MISQADFLCKASRLDKLADRLVERVRKMREMARECDSVPARALNDALLDQFMDVLQFRVLMAEIKTDFPAAIAGKLARGALQRRGSVDRKRMAANDREETEVPDDPNQMKLFE